MTSFHEQAAAPEVDVLLAPLIEWCNAHGFWTYESCQNYGEYLRDLGFDHVLESKRDYAYIEFHEVEDAVLFMDFVKDWVGVDNPIHHQIANEGTPGTWELKMRNSTRRFWLWFPADDIGHLQRMIA